MQLEITASDIDEAERRVKCSSTDRYARPLHCWHNPIAVAVERVLGPEWYCTVSHNWFSIAHRNGSQHRIPIDGMMAVYLREWERGVCSVANFLVPLHP